MWIYLTLLRLGSNGSEFRPLTKGKAQFLSCMDEGMSSVDRARLGQGLRFESGEVTREPSAVTRDPELFGSSSQQESNMSLQSTEIQRTVVRRSSSVWATLYLFMYCCRKV